MPFFARTAVVAGGLVAALALAGCGTSSSRTSSPTTSPAPSTSASGGASPTSAAPSSTAPPTTAGSGSTLSPATVASGGAPAACSAGVLSGSLIDGEGAAGSFDYVLSLRNTGSTACTLDGYPGVSYVTGSSGTQVGAAAQRVTQAYSKLTIGPTGTAQAVITEVDAADFPPSTCHLTATRGLRVYPPGQTDAIFVPQRAKACTDPSLRQLTVQPLAPGPGD